MDSQVQGVNPNTLGEEIVPSLNVDRHIFLAKGLTIAEAVFDPIVGMQTLVNLTTMRNLNASRIWWLRGYSISLYSENLTNALEARCAVSLFQQGKYIFPPFFYSGDKTIGIRKAADAYTQASWSQEVPLADMSPLIPGDSVTFSVEYLSAVPAPAGTLAAYCSIWYYDLPY